jgi:hypothetical protein
LDEKQSCSWLHKKHSGSWLEGAVIHTTTNTSNPDEKNGEVITSTHEERGGLREGSRYASTSLQWQI